MGARSTSQLQQQAQHALERQQLAEEVPPLLELERRLREATEPALVQARETVLYYLGLARLHTGDAPGAAENLAEFVQRYPAARLAASARLMLGDAWFAQARWGEARSAYDELRRDASALANLDGAQQLALWDRLSDCCFALQDWAEGPEVFRSLQTAVRRHIDPSQHLELSAKAGAYLLQAAIARDELESALAALASWGASGGSIRYDLSLNLALVRGGDAWYERGHYSEALHFYERVLPPPELRAYWEEAVRRAATPQVWDELGATRGRSQARAEAVERARQRLEQLDGAIASGAAAYAAPLRFRIARCYLALQRTYEAYWAFERLQQASESAEAWAEEALYGLVVAAAANRQPDRVRGAARTYLDHPQYQRFLGEIVHELAESEQGAGRAAELEPWWRELVERLRTAPRLVAAPRVIFVIGSSLFAQEERVLLQELFEPLVALAEPVPWGDGLRYWLGLAAVFEGAFVRALDDFEWVVREHRDGVYAEDAAFRIGVCRFGLLQYEEAQRVLVRFVADFPASRLISEAQALLGDLAAAEGRVEAALEAYRAAETAGARLDPPHLPYINHAVFQGGRLLAANQRWAEMAVWFSAYVERWGRDGRLSDALYELGRAQTAQGQHAEALDGWLRAIVRFGNDPRDDGPDLMLAEYPRRYYEATGRSPVEELRGAMEAAVAGSQPTLALRLADALRELGCDDDRWPASDGSEMDAASAAVLVRRAETLAETQPERALAAVEVALARQPAAPIQESAWHLAGQLRAQAGDLDGARDAYRRAAEQFPASPRAAVAKLREGDLLRRAGQYDAAIAAYRTVLQTRQWRGVPWAEANFKIGLTHFEAGEWKEAFGFSQRVYVLYGSVAEWAAPAYLQSGRALEGLGRDTEAAATYRELLGRDDLRDTPAGREAAQRLAALP